MKLNQEETIKLFLRIKSPKIIDELYYSIDESKTIISLKNRERIKSQDNVINLKLNKIFTDEDSINDIYQNTSNNIIKESLAGIPFCFINYGETCSDKLNTLIGDLDNESINQNGIFNKLYLELNNYINQNEKKKNLNIILQYSFMCINNSKVIDLNNFFKKDISTLKIDDFTQKGKLIQSDKNLINSIQKIYINNLNYSNIFSFIIKIIKKFKNNLDFFSNSYFAIILYINKKNKEEIIPLSNITFILLNGSEKLNILQNIKNKDKNLISSELKKNSLIASKNAISTQNNYNSIIYLIKQNKVFNINNINKENNEVKLSEEEIKETEINEGRYISSLTAVLYNICFDYKIKNIKYIIFADIFPNIGYYKSVKDSILFLLEISKIINKNVKNNINIEEKNKNLLETNYLLDLETKISQQDQTINALSEICQNKNKKIFFLENEYNSQITQLKNILGFDGDIRILLSKEPSSPEAKKAKIIRESGNKIYKLTEKLKNMEKKLKKSKEEIEKYKSNEDIIKTDSQMLKYLSGIKYMKEEKLNEMKLKSFLGLKALNLEKELKNKNFIIKELEKDLDNKNKIIQKYSKLCNIKKINEVEENDIYNNNNDINKTEEKNNKEENEEKKKKKEELEYEKIIQIYEKRINEEKEFWRNQINIKDNDIKEIEKQFNKFKEKNNKLEKEMEIYKKNILKLNEDILNNKSSIKLHEEELIKLNQILMDIIYNYNSYFIRKSNHNINYITLKSKLNEFNEYIIQQEKGINQLSFPLLHEILEKNNKLGINYRTKVDRNKKLNLNIKKSISSNNIIKKDIEKNKENQDNNITTKFPEGNITKNYLEQMNKNDLIEYCLVLNQRINSVGNYAENFQKINIENEENKKQITYLNFKIKRLISELEIIHEINNNNKIVINSQNRTIEKFEKNRLMININNNNIDDLAFSLSPKKSLRFNKSQLNFKTFNDINYNDFPNRHRNQNKKYITKNKTQKTKAFSKIKELHTSNDNLGINSDNQTLDTNNLNDFIQLSIKEYGNNKNMKNEFSSFYPYFYSQN